jgi:transcriptional regulator with XRE-family HTH domain
MDEPEAQLAVAVSRALRLARSRDGRSQRDLSVAAGVARSVIGRLEAGQLPASVGMLVGLLHGLGFALEVVAPTSVDAGDLWRSELRDDAGRRFPAHVEAVKRRHPPSYWYPRNGGWLTTVEPPVWSWRRPWHESWPQPPSAASTTSLASACTCARCSGPRNDSA